MLYFPMIISILEVLTVTTPILLTVAFVTNAERKTMASMQRRLGAIITLVVKGGPIFSANNFLWAIVSHNFCGNYRVKPHRFSTEQLQSDMNISEIIVQIDT